MLVQGGIVLQLQIIGKNVHGNMAGSNDRLGGAVRQQAGPFRKRRARFHFSQVSDIPH